MRSNYRMLDLFSGMGGLSYGFSMNNFNVTGIELNQSASLEYTRLTGGNNINASVSNYRITENYDVIAGGPPCKPWSPVNLQRRGKTHRDYHLVSEFFSIILDRKPRVFIMENVPFIRNDPIIRRGIEKLKVAGYDISSRIVTYSDFGAATSRSRFFITGTLDIKNQIFDYLSRYIVSPVTVRDVIWRYHDMPENFNRDHVWPHVKTIHRYIEKYSTGRFGWRRLEWGKPAPSFGNVTKTYILHPDSTPESESARTISVFEALNIMGFYNFNFSPGLPLSLRYQMVVDSVSPVFSLALASVIKQILEENPDEIPARY
ncbi:MAG: DNA cytosine methyltransferase [Candidatus Thermoplasmatota archaeon]|nr:DNA cytosine methyltransferase [Candidatus Thermoplasmatota archaeon]